jgi:hypothetical protein
VAGQRYLDDRPALRVLLDEADSPLDAVAAVVEYTLPEMSRVA